MIYLYEILLFFTKQSLEKSNPGIICYGYDKKANSMKKYFLIIVVFILGQVHAQTGIGTTTPDASAKLEVSATNKGFLPPRVTLTSGTDNTTIPTPATGLLVYNTGNNAGLVSGYYYWNGTSWATIATASGSGVSASILRGSRTSGQTGLTNGGNVIFTQVDNVAGQEMALNTSTGQITLTAGRTYRLMAQVPNFQTSAAETRTQFAWYNETTGAYIGSSSNTYTPSSAASYGSTGGLSEAVITTTTSTVVSYRIAQLSNTTQLGGSPDFTNTGAFPWFEAQVISGNTAVNGQSVDYVNVVNTNTQTLATGNNIKFNTIIAGNIPYDASTGNFSLTAGKTYRLSGFISLDGTTTSASELSSGWKNAAGTSLGATSLLFSASINSTAGGQGVADVIYTPTTNTTVSLNVAWASGTVVTRAGYVTATIQQIGSSAIVNPWTLAGTNTYNTTGNVGIGNNAPTATLDVTGSLAVSGAATLKNTLNVGTGSGLEGGEIDLANAVSGTTLTGNVGIDVYGDKLRIFENGGTARGVNIDLSKAPAGVSGELLWKTSYANMPLNTPLSLDNISVQIRTQGVGVWMFVNALSGSPSWSYSLTYQNGSGVDGGSQGMYNTWSVASTTPTALGSTSYVFANAGRTLTALITDITANKMYRVSWQMTISSSPYGNYVVIERLL